MGSRGSSMYHSSGKRWHYSTLLLLALGAAMLSVLVVHKLREGRVLGLLLHDRESQLLSLQLILERERSHSKEMKAKIEELKAKAASLRSQKMRLNTRLMEAENLAAYLKHKRIELELALEEKQAKLTSLKGVEEASVKANKQVEALTDSLKQQQGNAGEMERRLQQPSNQQVNTTLVDDLSKSNETDERTSKEETATNKDGGAKDVEKSEHGQGSKGGGWVRIETNTDDAVPAGDADDESAKEGDHGKEKSSEGAKQSEVAVQVGDQNKGEAISEQKSTVGGELQVMKDELTSTDTAETNVVASEDGKLEEEDNNTDGEEKQTKENSQTENSQHEESSKTDEKQTDNQVIDGNATEVNSAEAQLKLPESQEEKQTTEDSQSENSQHEESSKTDGKQTDNQVIDGKATEVNSAEAQLKLPENQTASTQAEAAGEQSQVNAVSLGESVSSDGDEDSETKRTSTESYQDTNGSDEKTNGDDSGEQQRVSDKKESNTSEGAALHEEGGPENKEENNVRSTMETSEQSAASHEGQTQNVHGSEEGESSGKEDQGSGQSGSEQLGEKITGDEEEKTSASTALTQQAANDTESAERGRSEQ
ncbi:hypothetical protein Taro_036467 [Colocasia esculenta]|uniref:Uncharacterized protein n=1 Tax=Colocasia esculenta TaxID=4460 RepID=A0A843W9V1_COLES|nr:hypothetical protein [Colocasia esculenta]